ncbi:VOC family protein [Streptomyces subrutilus]|uniref:Extradiol dioxygenase n=1 Tax=Streptomyces subrutilus TaxID=36818 RepID=A0A5P2UUN5_9ACTN|nr:VOC family protein [Streptomyces subrutilus]QEU82039.1 VOC family protein [Streptomyces subrutilus]WSJ28501.1 VOC family protein [Streptomyces subrutilus]GGZ72791.1 extradiol dioxygenase [Streptomyces subrutilus]
MTVKKTSVLVLDCADAESLALFYADLLGAEVRPGPGADFVEVVGGAGVHLAIRRDTGYAPPSWPRPEDSQQAHLRIVVAPGDLDEAEREAVSLGARPLEADAEDGPHDARLLSDPAGHSFTLATSGPAR